LREKQARFRALPGAEKRRLRSLHRQICGGDSGGELYGVLSRYTQWLATLPDGQRADLLELPPPQRIEQIRTIRESQEATTFGMQAGDIAAQDIMVVARWLHEYVRMHDQELLAQLPKSVRQRIDRLEPGRRRTRQMLLEIGEHLDEIELPPPQPGHLQDMVDQLPPEASRRLRQIVNLDDGQEATRRLLKTLVQSIQHLGSRMIPDERLQEFYDQQLTSQQRDRLDSMPPEAAKRELRRQFMMHHMGNRRRTDLPQRGGPGQRQRRNPGKRGMSVP
jgi:hypothetical protein